MKSPKALAEKLARQWENPDRREQALLLASAWPMRLNIGRPGATLMVSDPGRVRRHLDQWRRVDLGTVCWEKIVYRSTGIGVDIPVTWELASPSQWVAATGSCRILKEYRQVAALVAAADAMFHSFLVRNRWLAWGKKQADVLMALALTMELEPLCAKGLPLRSLCIAGNDTKFFERNRTLLTRLLDIRFNGRAGNLGLEAFLGALDENDHWLLLADLDGRLLPFEQLRVRARELVSTPLPAGRILVVENEQSFYQLPCLKDTICILGAGLNLAWMEAAWLKKKNLAYWGDLDSWGLSMLASARRHQPHLTPLLMTRSVFDRHAGNAAVIEEDTAGPEPPFGLTPGETRLYLHLIGLEQGRLEQEFLDRQEVEETVNAWASGSEP